MIKKEKIHAENFDSYKQTLLWKSQVKCDPKLLNIRSCLQVELKTQGLYRIRQKYLADTRLLIFLSQNGSCSAAYFLWNQTLPKLWAPCLHPSLEEIAVTHGRGLRSFLPQIYINLHLETEIMQHPWAFVRLWIEIKNWEKMVAM